MKVSSSLQRDYFKILAMVAAMVAIEEAVVATARISLKFVPLSVFSGTMILLPGSTFVEPFAFLI